MALKGRGVSKALKGIKQVAKGVQEPMIDNPNRKKQRTTTGKPLPSEPGGERKTTKFSEITITGSKGERYTVVVPTSYLQAVPKVWEWNEERYKVAELIAEGIPIAQIPDQPGVTIRSRMTIYGWLEHPEFKEHVDALVLETGWANRRERIANLQHLNKILLRKVANEIDGIKLTDKSLGAVLSALQGGSKLIAQEKGEFIEETKVTQDTTITGTMGVATMDIDKLLQGKTEDERKELEKEFDEMGDDVIRALTGNK